MWLSERKEGKGVVRQKSVEQLWEGVSVGKKKIFMLGLTLIQHLQDSTSKSAGIAALFTITKCTSAFLLYWEVKFKLWWVGGLQWLHSQCGNCIFWRSKKPTVLFESHTALWVSHSLFPRPSAYAPYGWMIIVAEGVVKLITWMTSQIWRI